jgi:hypothetical protein
MMVEADWLDPLTLPEGWRESFIAHREVPGRGLCVLERFAFTTGLLVNVKIDGHFYDYDARYCYPLYVDALRALATWDGKGDPGEAWIKEKVSGRPHPSAPKRAWDR